MRRFADPDAPGSFSNRKRARRFKGFEELLSRVAARLDRPVRVLDVGGTNSFWEQRGWADREDVRIVVANIAAEPKKHANIEPVVADATRMDEFEDRSFDIVFSNSVIEHLRTYEAQAAMASEVRRLAGSYWIQTPNFWFPIEPHFLTPGWHWLPVSARIALLRRRRWGWLGPCPDPDEARALVEEVRLMRRREFSGLFPDARLIKERFCGLTKSFVVARP
jgi:hypothetical protein